MIDFSKIHPHSLGQRISFEEFVCQLARGEAFPKDSIYKRVEGAGGDGGVEAYWTKPNGKKTGYQAKYFLRSGDIDWSQVDKSVTQMLATHQEMECFVIAFPCDLTEKSGKKRKGKTGWEHWDSRVKKWTTEAAAAGFKEIAFKAWPTSSLIERLTKDSSKGLREFFFGKIELSAEWFSDKVQESILALGERFHPEDHVDIRIEKLFSVISRTPKYKDELLEALHNIEQCTLPIKGLSELIAQPEKEIIDNVQSAFIDLLTIKNQIESDPQQEWDSYKWYQSIQEVLSANMKFQKWCIEYDSTLEKGMAEKDKLSKVSQKSWDLHETLESLIKLIQSKYMDAEKNGVAFVRGKAGSGKSHLLAQSAKNAIDNNQPVILLLGQRLNNSELWLQISQQLGLPGRSADEVLGALDASGKANNTRALVLIDAINEGVGSEYWQTYIASLITKIKQYSHVCSVVSCRSEYFELAIPNNIAQMQPTFEIQGFETAEEQLNAARVYLDRRGIARPSTPWLSPEFINPLFLRSVCLSLERDGKSEFPSGLTGTNKILKYYLKSIGQNINEKEGGAVSLTPKLLRATQAIAGTMFENKTDYLSPDTCNDVIIEHIKNIAPQTEPDWLSVFLNNGVLRKDPNPSIIDDFDDEEVVRFSFQRFQDFLMAEHSLKGVVSADGLFETQETLGFCIEDNKLNWEWLGLLDGLAIALPEKLGVELIDTLPGGYDAWCEDYDLPDIFAESVKWREHFSFTARTRELLNLYNEQIDPFEILLQVAVSSEHPWNAELLHEILQKRSLPDRDSFWTTWLNGQGEDAGSSIDTLIDWCRNGQAPQTNSKNQFLAGLTLCWLFTSSNRPIRDKATKGLTSIFLTNNAIFPELFNRFNDTDDLYILERLLAAAYASCCLNPNTEQLSEYSKLIYDKFFKLNHPPMGMLLRDYALGVIELANHHSALPDTVEFERCKPPYKSPMLDLTVSEEHLNEVAEQAGDNSISNSAARSMGDFANYEIQPRVSRFLQTLLNEAIPLSNKHKARIFEDTIINSDCDKVEAYKLLRYVANPPPTFHRTSISRELEEPTVEEVAKQTERIEIVENALFKLLNTDEINQFHTNAAPYIYGKIESESVKKFDYMELKRWVAKRAYDYGWTRERFEYDSSGGSDYSRSRPFQERIGKKYQWLALDELLCCLADNYWIAGEYGDIPSAYNNPIDLGYNRDIDPTIVVEKENHSRVAKDANSWAFQPWIDIDHVEEESLASWPCQKDPTKDLKELPFRTDLNGEKWLVLYEHQSITEKYPGERHIGAGHDSRLQEFRFLETVLVKSTDAPSIAANIKREGLSSGVGWASLKSTDSAFFHEAPWRSTWSQEKWLLDSRYSTNDTEIAQLLAEYVWEANLDAALPKGYYSHLPTPWIIRELNLHIDQESAGTWLNQNGEVVFQEFKGNEGGNICLLRMNVAEEILAGELTLMTTLIAERNTWPRSGSLSAAWRRSEGVCWNDGNRIKHLAWFRDENNNKSNR